MSQQEETTNHEELFEATESRIRHIGYVVFFGILALIVFPMFIAIIQGIQQDRVWDPFTDLPVATDEDLVDCREEAGDLIYLAGEMGELEGEWELRYRRWISRCQDDHLELFPLLEQTRNRLQGSEEPPTLKIDEAPADD